MSNILNYDNFHVTVVNESKERGFFSSATVKEICEAHFEIRQFKGTENLFSIGRILGFHPSLSHFLSESDYVLFSTYKEYIDKTKPYLILYHQIISMYKRNGK